MAQRCCKCSQTDSSPRNFLLQCSTCLSSWHHRCHNPVIQDRSLVALIKATTKGDTNKGLPSWKCGNCQRPPEIIDLTLSDSESEHVKPEETSVPLHPSSVQKYNLLPAWIHRRHLDQILDPWDHLAKKKTSHRSKRVGKPLARNLSTSAKVAFVFSAAAWLAERKAALS